MTVKDHIANTIFGLAVLAGIAFVGAIVAAAVHWPWVTLGIALVAAASWLIGFAIDWWAR